MALTSNLVTKSVSMKNLFFLNALFVILFCRCSDKNLDIDGLREMDSTLWPYSELFQFSRSDLSKKEINNISVCFQATNPCKEGERDYLIVLNEIGIQPETFHEVVNKMKAIGFKTYYKYENYSIWVMDGAFGSIYGYLINHNSTEEITPSFELMGFYRISVGKQVSDNVYYFSS
jgi:hypothetical protein